MIKKITILVFSLLVSMCVAHAQENGSWGAIDETFKPLLSGNVMDMELLPDGKMIVVGSFKQAKLGDEFISCRGIMRLMPNGEPDVTFNEGGAGFDNTVVNIAKTADGKYVVCGRFTKYNDVAVDKVARLNADGSLDETFKTDNVFELVDFPSAYDLNVTQVMINSAGQIYLTGAFNKVNGVFAPFIARFDADGNHDATYQPVNSVNPKSAPNVLSTYMDANDSFFITGYFSKYGGTIGRNAIVRFNSDGSLDEEFAMHEYLDPYESMSTIKSVAPYNGQDGKYLVAGDFTTVDGQERFLTVVLDRKGQIDTDYKPYNFLKDNEDAAWACYAALSYQDYVFTTGGDLFMPNTAFVHALTADGSQLSTDFTIGKPNRVPSFLKVDPRGWLYVSGLFRKFSGVVANYFVRLSIPATPMALDEVNGASELICQQQGNRLHVIAPVGITEVVVYDIYGRVVEQSYSEGCEAWTGDLPMGMFIISARSIDQGKLVTKVVLR